MPGKMRIPRGGGRTPSLRGILVIDSTRGNPRVRAWPKKRGHDRHPTNTFWTDWLRAVTFLYRYQPAKVHFTLQEMTRGTPWMPRDVFISAARGRAFMWSDNQGRMYYPMAYREGVSRSLDAIAQLPGYMLYRSGSLWAAIAPGTEGQVLTSHGPDAAPEWLSPGTLSECSINLMGGGTAATTYNVNSTSYVDFTLLGFMWDRDEFPFTEYRISVSGNSNAASQTITLQLVRGNTAGNNVHSGGNDLVVSNTPSLYNSGWLTADSPGSGYQEYTLAMKGSNSTVDLSCGRIAVTVR